MDTLLKRSGGDWQKAAAFVALSPLGWFHFQVVMSRVYNSDHCLNHLTPQITSKQTLSACWFALEFVLKQQT